jgi:UDP-glucose 4-epimerase
MTRFLMSLEDSVNLVLYAFKNAKPGDIFIQKAPAATISTIAKAISLILNKTSKVKIIGTRHGEKLFESLVSLEEMMRAEDMNSYYRIPADARDLNYNQYFNEGEKDLDAFCEYTSHSTERLDTQRVVELFAKLDIFKELNV